MDGNGQKESVGSGRSHLLSGGRATIAATFSSVSERGPSLHTAGLVAQWNVDDRVVADTPDTWLGLPGALERTDESGHRPGCCTQAHSAVSWCTDPRARFTGTDCPTLPAPWPGGLVCTFAAAGAPF